MRLNIDQVILIVVFFALLGFMGVSFYFLRTNAPSVINFDQCAAIYQVTQGSPPICTTPEGRVFINQSPNESDEERLSHLGVVKGQVTIGPNCPVETNDNPCATPPEVYTSREILLYNGDKKSIIKRLRLKEDGSYYVELPPGNYVIDIEHMSVGGSKDLPRSIRIDMGTKQTFDFSIDTGIR